MCQFSLYIIPFPISKKKVYQPHIKWGNILSEGYQFCHHTVPNARFVLLKVNLPVLACIGREVYYGTHCIITSCSDEAFDMIIQKL